MDIQMQTKMLSLNNNGSLKISYNKNDTKFAITDITLKRENKSQLFLWSETWVNNQPANYLKGFKAQLIENDFSFKAYILEDKLHLFYESSTQAKQINVEYNNQFYTFAVSPYLKPTGLDSIVERTLGHTNFKVVEKISQKTLKFSILGDCSDPLSLKINLKTTDIETPKINSGFATSEMGEGNRLFVDFKHENSFVIEKNPPSWRTLQDGVNLVGACYGHIFTTNCKAFGEEVYIPLGTKTFSLYEEIVKNANCPACFQKINNISNCIFWNCVYTIEGVPHSKKQLESVIPKTQTPNKVACSFAPNYMTSWNIVKISCSPISKKAYYLLFAAAVIGIFAGLYQIKKEKK